MTSAPRRFALVLVALACVVGSVLGAASTAGATTSDDLAAARQKLDDAKRQGDELAAAFTQADHELEATQAGITELEHSIVQTKARAAALRTVAKERAVFAYTHPSNQLEELVDSSDAVGAIRRQQLLDQANQTDHDVVKKLAAVNAQLESQRSDLAQQEQRQRALRDGLDTKLAAVQQQQAETAQLVSDLQVKLDTEIKVAAYADAVRKAQLEAEKAALVAQQAPATGQAGQIVASAVNGPFSCPVLGASYGDDYGGPSGHPGIDMLVPIGTKAMAVRAGTVTFAPNEGAGGNAAYLNADDGNTYYYAHFSGYVGGPRAVAKGEVIGLTGMTGNATGPHLHFEIRLGGPNGNRTDPYPTLKAAGC
jgi:murein DD-endopeptidase MepM/ murein hydrolase activator NlpD